MICDIFPYELSFTLEFWLTIRFVPILFSIYFLSSCDILGCFEGLSYTSRAQKINHIILIVPMSMEKTRYITHVMNSSPEAHLIIIDKDPTKINKSKTRLRARLHPPVNKTGINAMLGTADVSFPAYSQKHFLSKRIRVLHQKGKILHDFSVIF